VTSEEARGFVHLAGCECQGTTRKALDIIISDSEKLEQIKEIIKDHDNDSCPEDYWYIDKIREILKE
jgi:hypothetical protein